MLTENICDDDKNLYDCDVNLNNNSDECIISNIISKLRLLFQKLRKSDKLLTQFQHLCSALKIKYLKPILDTKIRWNSTNDMLAVALDLKAALTALCIIPNNKLTFLKLEEDEWSILEQVKEYLSYFSHVSTLISADTDATLSEALIAFNMLLDEVEIIINNLKKKEKPSKNDEILLCAMEAGRFKLLKHYKKCNWIYCVALILDPRFKTVGFQHTKWGKEMKSYTVEKFKEMYEKMYSATPQNNEKAIESPPKKNKKNRF